jgi:hypothetical protein
MFLHTTTITNSATATTNLFLQVPFDDPELELATMPAKERLLRTQYNEGIKVSRILIERVNARLKNR